MQEAQQADLPGKKPCVACGEMIPASATICSHCLQRQTPEKPARMKSMMGWVGTATALIGLGASVAGGFHWLQARHRQQTELRSLMAVADGLAQQGEYQSAVESYGDALKVDPGYRPALDAQLDATMRWAENFHMLEQEGQSTSQLAGQELDQVLTILNAGLAGAKGSRAADIRAHVGWTHWLNWHIAEREYGPAAEQNLRAALADDPTNVYANAMLGNWLLQNGGKPAEAISHFKLAVATGRERPFVRQFQLAALTDDDTPESKAALMEAADEMRKDGEFLDKDTRRRVMESGCDDEPDAPSGGGVPSEEEKATCAWLEGK